ncbi:Glyoxylate reductase [uncultured archaeon]|nr:Glyoxylate reductase [uncultured archaeon]
MKFKKIVTIGISESSLDANYWKTIDSLAEKRISLPKDSPEVKKQLEDADCILAGFGVKIDKNIIDISHELKFIGMLGTGYGNIDADHARTKNIAVTNVPGYAAEAVAELVFGMILENIRELEKAKKKAREGNYSDSGYKSSEIRGKVFGIFGLGRIGSRAAEIASGFGADVRYWSRNRKKELEAKGITYEDADALIPKCDFLSLHFSQTKDTENFLNEKRMQKIKNGAIVINTAPMELVNIDALEKRLKEDNVTFILDHSDEMKEDDLKRLSKYKNCIIYPPIGYITKEARIAKQDIFVKNIENFLKGSPTNRVN